jgi:hypothetical protein
LSLAGTQVIKLGDKVDWRMTEVYRVQAVNPTTPGIAGKAMIINYGVTVR